MKVCLNDWEKLWGERLGGLFDFELEPFDHFEKELSGDAPSCVAFEKLDAFFGESSGSFSGGEREPSDADGETLSWTAVECCASSGEGLAGAGKTLIIAGCSKDSVG